MSALPLSPTPTTGKAYLQSLATRCWSNPDGLTCRELVAIFRHTYGLQLTGVTADRLVRLHRVYARRVDELGPEQFDALANGEAWDAIATTVPQLPSGHRH
jgi:hypothetical protein